MNFKQEETKHKGQQKNREKEEQLASAPIQPTVYLFPPLYFQSLLTPATTAPLCGALAKEEISNKRKARPISFYIIITGHLMGKNGNERHIRWRTLARLYFSLTKLICKGFWFLGWVVEVVSCHGKLSTLLFQLHLLGHTENARLAGWLLWRLAGHPAEEVPLLSLSSSSSSSHLEPVLLLRVYPTSIGVVGGSAEEMTKRG